METTHHNQAAWDDFVKSATPPVVIRRRRLRLVVAAGVAILLGLAIHSGNIHNDPPPANSPDIMEVGK